MRFTWIAILLLMLSACARKTDRFTVTEFNHPVEVSIHRFDLDFITMDTNNVEMELEKLEAKYPDFYPVFMAEALRLFDEDRAAHASLIRDFLLDNDFKQVHKDLKKILADVTTTERRLSTGFSYLQHYFPEITIPEIYFFVSGFNHQFLLHPEMMGVGSDLYLGSDYPHYPYITYDYLLGKMRKELLAVDVMTSLLHRNFNFNSDINLLNTMLYEGKIMYLLSIFMPDLPDADLIGYSADQLNWCKKYEKQSWSVILENKHLYSTDYMTINKFINDAPFTSPVSQEAPGRLGVWIGWQIVRNFMQNNQDIGLEDLMKLDNYQFILEKSLYRP